MPKPGTLTKAHMVDAVIEQNGFRAILGEVYDSGRTAKRKRKKNHGTCFFYQY